MRIKRHNNGDLYGDRFKTNTIITHLAEDIVVIDPAPHYVAHVGIDPSTDDCDEIIHDVSAMVCRLAADVDAVAFEGDNEDILFDRPVQFVGFEYNDGEIYDAGFIAQLTSNWDEELCSASKSTDASYGKDIY
jgi:hypothetical protein